MRGFSPAGKKCLTGKRAACHQLRSPSPHPGATSGVHTKGKLLRAVLKLARTEVRRTAGKTVKVKENYRTMRQVTEISWLPRSSRKENALELGKKSLPGCPQQVKRQISYTNKKQQKKGKILIKIKLFKSKNIFFKKCKIT